MVELVVDLIGFNHRSLKFDPNITSKPSKPKILCVLLVLRLYIGDVKTKLQVPVVKLIRDLINIYNF